MLIIHPKTLSQTHGELSAVRFARAYHQAIHVQLRKKAASRIHAQKKARRSGATTSEWPPHLPSLEQLLPKRDITVAQQSVSAYSAPIPLVEHLTYLPARRSEFIWVVPHDVSDDDDALATESSRQDCNDPGCTHSKPAAKQLSRGWLIALKELYEKKYGKLAPYECKRLRAARAIVAALEEKRERQQQQAEGAHCSCFGGKGA